MKALEVLIGVLVLTPILVGIVALIIHLLTRGMDDENSSEE